MKSADIRQMPGASVKADTGKHKYKMIYESQQKDYHTGNWLYKWGKDVKSNRGEWGTQELSNSRKLLQYLDKNGGFDFGDLGPTPPNRSCRQQRASPVASARIEKTQLLDWSRDRRNTLATACLWSSSLSPRLSSGWTQRISKPQGVTPQ